MTKLERLERRARQTAEGSDREHRLSTFTETSKGRRSFTASAVCLRVGCTRGVQVDTDPPANGIDIGGAAVALGCIGERYAAAGMLVDMDDARERTSVLGGSRYWFEPDTIRFFGSRIAEYGYLSADAARTYFVSSERDSHGAWDGQRRYSVRVQDRATGEIDTVGEFGQYGSRSGADHRAQREARA